MDIGIEKQGNVTIFRITGDVDLYSAESLKKGVAAEVANGARNVVINLKEVNYLDSSGIGALIVNYQTIKKSGGDLKIASLQPTVAKIFTLANLMKFFHIFETEDEAVGSFS